MFRTFLATFKHSRVAGVAERLVNIILKKGNILKTPSNKYCFDKFHELDKQKLIQTNSQTDQVIWVNQRRVK